MPVSRCVSAALVSVAGLIALSALAGWSASRQPQSDRTAPAAHAKDITRQTGVAVQWMGSSSSIEMPRIELVTDPSDWEKLYTEHTRQKPEKNANGFLTWPKVDFDKYVVVAVFAGKGHNSNGVEAVSVTQSVAGVLLRFDEQMFQTASFNGGPSGIATTAYGFFVIERLNGTWVLEENTQNMIGAAPKWTERKRFDLREKLPGVK